MELRITTLIENMKDEKEQLISEHGLSMYIEFEGKKILFDTGQTGEFLSNAKALHKPVEEIDYLIISHGHYDHSGGLMNLVNTLINDTPMYVGKEFFDKKYKVVDENYQYNGNPFKMIDLQDKKVMIHTVSTPITYLSEKIFIFKQFKRTNDFEQLNQKFVIKSENGVQVDHFEDEIALGLHTTKGLVLLVGCSHVGIANIISNVTSRVKIPIYAVIGGTHLVNANELRIDKTIEVIKKQNLGLLAVSHCTGQEGMEKVKKEFPDIFEYNNTGHVISI